jgi:hypothetical protein
MTKEQYDTARDYRQDIYLLDCIRDSQLKNHWVKFVTPDGLNREGYSDVLVDDFEEWVQKEREKLEKLFEEL